MYKSGGGALTCGDESCKSLTVKVTSAAQSGKVTAVPEDGYVFVKWSDGVTKRTRTDTNFDQNVDVTAVFAAASIQVSSSGKAIDEFIGYNGIPRTGCDAPPQRPCSISQSACSPQGCTSLSNSSVAWPMPASCSRSLT